MSKGIQVILIDGSVLTEPTGRKARVRKSGALEVLGKRRTRVLVLPALIKGDADHTVVDMYRKVIASYGPGSWVTWAEVPDE